MLSGGRFYHQRGQINLNQSCPIKGFVTETPFCKPIQSTLTI
ncbi:hypothetical protein MWLf4_1758 [Limosilactobacillus fermentum]|nr:hypothetical protein MWLf4_1758 [Limosilactobacillus fermentum]